MQLLKIPLTSDTMHCSMSLTGITILKKGSYKCRHNLKPQLTQVYKKGVVLTKTTDRHQAPVTAKKKTKINEPTPEIVDKPVKKIRYYQIDKKQVQHKIKNFILQQKGEKQLYFWTITFPLGTTDDTAFVLLNKWLTRLRDEKMLKSYLWVSERQSNGTIHFHIAVNNRMCVKKANKFMRASIMHSINKGEIVYSRIDAMRYNGVDIAKNRKTRRVTNFAQQKAQKALVNYLTKYITKNDGQFTHLAWHSSRDYSNLVTAVRVSGSEWISSNTRQFIDEKPLFESEWYSFHKWKDGPPGQLTNYLSELNFFLVSNFN